MSSILSPFKPCLDFQPYLRPLEILKTPYRLSGSLTDYQESAYPTPMWLVSLFKAPSDFEVHLTAKSNCLKPYKPLQVIGESEDNFYSKFIKRNIIRYIVKYMQFLGYPKLQNIFMGMENSY